MIAKLQQPAPGDSQNKARSMVTDENGNPICEGFLNKESQDRLQLLVDQSNKYLELKAIVDQIVKDNLVLCGDVQAFLSDASNSIAHDDDNLHRMN